MSNGTPRAAIADPLTRAFALIEHIAKENDARAKTCDLLAARGGANARQHIEEAKFRRDDARALRALLGTTQKIAAQLIEAKTPWWRRVLDRLRASRVTLEDRLPPEASHAVRNDAAE